MLDALICSWYIMYATTMDGPLLLRYSLSIQPLAILALLVVLVNPCCSTDPKASLLAAHSSLDPHQAPLACGDTTLTTPRAVACSVKSKVGRRFTAPGSIETFHCAYVANDW